jgi:subtilisin family serine protease
VSEPLPAWSLAAEDVERVRLAVRWPAEVTREWALGGATGEGVRMCLVDSGVEADHPLVGPVQQAVTARVEGDEVVIRPDDVGDLCGHGTACAGIIRSIAPECELTSVRVLGAGYTGSARALLGGLRWAVEQGFDVINLSLSTTKKQFAAVLHDLADTAYFRRSILVASAHNLPVESYPWRFSSVVSVGSHEEADPLAWFYNPSPPVEFFARGLDVEVGWLGGGRIRCTGNSFATASSRCDLRADPVQAPRADAFPAQERPLPDCLERGDVSDLRAAVAAAALGAEEAYEELLTSVVEVACAIFGAKASSIFLLDEDADELVFAAVSGEGSAALVGRRFPSSTGIAGWVLVTRQPLVVEDVAQDPRFAQEAAESTGYVPRGLMAAPLLRGDRALGVLEVLDRPTSSRFTLAEIDLLGLFASQAAIALDLLLRARTARGALDGGEAAGDALARFATALESLDDDAAERLLDALAQALAR